jgi:hypothetical protein
LPQAGSLHVDFSIGVRLLLVLGRIDFKIIQAGGFSALELLQAISLLLLFLVGFRGRNIIS